MPTPDFIVDVNELNFEYDVVTYSQNVPVVVDFWADWCRPCKTLSPMLEQLAVEAGGAFRLARLDADANPNLTALYGVRTLPTVKAFSGGQVVSEFSGLLPESRLREFLSKITPPSPANLLLEKAASLLFYEKWEAAEKAYNQYLDTLPDQPAALLGLAKALLAQGKTARAESVLQHFPLSREFRQAEHLWPLVKEVQKAAKELTPLSDTEAAFQNCVHLLSLGKLYPALDGLLDILRQDRHYKEDRARQLVVGILEILGYESDQARHYRAELASILF